MGSHRLGVRRGCRGRGCRWPARPRGALGSLAPKGTWRDVVALVVVAVALGVDVSPLRRRLPTTRRQVNEDWMGRYRGWVYGVAFGAQLGTGVATIVTSAAVYAAALGRGPVRDSGRRGGGGSGLRHHPGALAAAGPWATDPAGLVRLHDRLGRAEAPARRAAIVAEAAAIALVVVGLL